MHSAKVLPELVHRGEEDKADAQFICSAKHCRRVVSRWGRASHLLPNPVPSVLSLKPRFFGKCFPKGAAVELPSNVSRLACRLSRTSQTESVQPTNTEAAAAASPRACLLLSTTSCLPTHSEYIVCVCNWVWLLYNATLQEEGLVTQPCKHRPSCFPTSSTETIG